jgi:hypothetical protein
MMGLRKHIYGLDFFDLESILQQKFDIPDHSDGIAGDVEQFEVLFLLELTEEIDDIFMQAVSGRIDDDESDVFDLGIEVRIIGKQFLGLSCDEENLVFQAINLGIVLCIHDSFRDNLYADEFLSFLGIEKAQSYASRPAIEIQDSSLYMSGHVHRQGKKLFGSQSIRLEKGEW